MSKRKLIWISIICLVLAAILTYSAFARSTGWFGTCRIPPSVEYSAELYRVRCDNGEIKVLDDQPAPRATWDNRTPTPIIIVVTVQPYPQPQPTHGVPYP